MSNTEETVICIAWTTPALKTTSFHYFHRSCYAGSSLPHQVISEVALEDIGCNAVCCGCWRKIREAQ